MWIHLKTKTKTVFNSMFKANVNTVVYKLQLSGILEMYAGSKHSQKEINRSYRHKVPDQSVHCIQWHRDTIRFRTVQNLLSDVSNTPA